MPLVEPPGRFFVRVAEDHLGVLAVRSPAEMVRDTILAAFFHRFLLVSVLCDASASMTLYGGEPAPRSVYSDPSTLEFLGVLCYHLPTSCRQGASMPTPQFNVRVPERYHDLLRLIVERLRANPDGADA